MSITFEDGRREILTNFLRSEGNPLCREERQYALFFYNALLDVKRNDDWKSFLELMDEEDIKEMLGLEKDIILEKIHIKQVFYEATLMRDLFHSCDDKNEFNKKLLEFVLSYKDPSGKVYSDWYEKKLKDLEGNESFGGPVGAEGIRSKIKYFVPEYREKPKDNKKESPIDMEHFNINKKKYIIASRLQLAKYMMNATPDILVYYTITIDGKEQEYVRAIECKYESEIGEYEDIFGHKRKLQVFVQRLIMTFLFGNEEMERQKKYTKLDVRTDMDRWNAVYGDLCIDIDTDMDTDIAKKDNNVGNMGVTVVKFTPTNNTIPAGCIGIDISKLLEVQYDSCNKKLPLMIGK